MQVVGAPTGEHLFVTRQDKTNVKIHTKKFKPETDKEWVKNCQYKHTIFLCDLRTGDGYVDTEIIRDMQLQKELTVKVNTAYSVVKFRPPYYRPHLFSTWW